MKIFARKSDGTVFECFTWTRCKASGIARAKRDAIAHGVQCVEFWAVEA
jgi:hypothetical protein